MEVKNSYNYEETQMKQIVLNIKARILKCFEVLKDSSHFIGYKGGTSWGRGGTSTIVVTTYAQLKWVLLKQNFPSSGSLIFSKISLVAGL